MTGEYNKQGIARRLAVLRDERGLSQAAVGALAGCNQRSIAEIEKAGSFSVRLLRDVASALGVTEQWMKTGRGAKDVGTIAELRAGNPAKPPSPEKLLQQFSDADLIAELHRRSKIRRRK